MYRVIFIVFASAFLAHAQTVDEIIARNIQARGGEATGSERPAWAAAKPN